jgi:hypothetical protein
VPGGRPAGLRHGALDVRIGHRGEGGDAGLRSQRPCTGIGDQRKLATLLARDLRQQAQGHRAGGGLGAPEATSTTREASASRSRRTTLVTSSSGSR